MVSVEGVCFVGKNQVGDYKWMIDQDTYEDALFVIHDNVLETILSDEAGGGTAQLRPYARFADEPRAVQIVTGWSVRCGGFHELDSKEESVIRVFFEYIRLYLKKHPEIKRLIFSCSTSDNDKIGQGVFKMADDVVSHISEELLSLQTSIEPRYATDFEDLDDDFDYFEIYAKYKDKEAECSSLKMRLRNEKKRRFENGFDDSDAA